MGLFEIDIKGFKQTLQQDAARILCEPIANAFDTEATEVTVEVSWERGQLAYRVEDNDPAGFEQLAEAYTLFAPSRRRHLTGKRGRFGYGEKEFIAVVYPGRVVIESTGGRVVFEGDRRTVSKSRRQEGSMVQAEMRLPRAEAERFVARLGTLLVPQGVLFRLAVRMGPRATPGERGPAGGTRVVQPRPPVTSFEAVLPTVHVGPDGNLRPARRTTRVDLVEPLGGEQPTIYELGIPVVTHDSRYSVNVHQKVPLGRDRDNVPPGYLRALRELILNHTYGLLDPAEAKRPWVAEALPGATPEALRTVVAAIHGKDAVIYDSSNPEASKKAMEQGRVVLRPRQFTPEIWKAIKQHDIVRPAGQVVATEPVSSPQGVPPILEQDWTEDMRRLAAYTRQVAGHLLGQPCEVRFQDLRRITTNAGSGGHYIAWWGDNTLTFNLGALGKKWPGTASQETVDALLIHEMSHSRAMDHTSAKFYETCCELGARLRSCDARLGT
jgi:hypothetical protein